MLLLFLGVSLVATRPLAARIRTATLAKADAAVYVWQVNWLSGHLLSPRELFESNIFVPTRHAALLSDLALGTALLVAPLRSLLRDPVALYNVGVIVTLTFGAWAFHRLVFAILWAEWLREEVLEPVPHRHVVLTMPRLMRPLFRRRRELLLDLSQCGAEALSEYIRREVGADTQPGIVVSVATSGDLLQWHPHGHVLVTDGAFSDDRTFHPLAAWDGEALMRLFRERLLARLVEKHAISQELATKLLTWRHPGFSAHVGEPIAADDTRAIENLAGYVTRNPLSLQRLVYLDGQQAVIYKGKHNPTLGRNFETMDPLEWLARMADHIPDPGKHRTLFYGHYANRARGDRAAEKPGVAKVEEEPAKKRRCTASWARLIAKVFHADPLTCGKCGEKLRIVAYLHDTVAINQVLDHLGLSPREESKPPPAMHEVVRVPVDEEGRLA